MLTFLITGTLLGLSAGFAPGPLLTLVISETVQYGAAAGIKVALVPIITDLPIIIVTLLILAKLSNFNSIIGIISIIGGCFIFYLGMESIKTRGVQVDTSANTSKSIQKGILVNTLSPYPYLFWFSVGGPLIIKAMDQDIAAAMIFILSFYALLVGAKILLAILVGKSRSFLLGSKYIFTMRTLGLILIILAGFLFRDGLQLLGVLTN